MGVAITSALKILGLISFTIKIMADTVSFLSTFIKSIKIYKTLKNLKI
jgi:hypothetical protein